MKSKSGEYIDPINKGDDSLGGKDDEGSAGRSRFRH